MSRRTKRFWLNKYYNFPTCAGKKECRRRLRQIRDGVLKGSDSFISIGARYAAIGLIHGTITTPRKPTMGGR